MIFLFAALFFSTAIFIVFRYFARYGIHTLPALTVNYLLAALAGLGSGTSGGHASGLLNQPWVLMAVVMGLTFMLTFVVFAVSTRKAGVALTVVSGKMSIVLSASVGFVMLGEPAGFLKLAGIATALVAFWLANAGKSNQGEGKGYYFLPVLIFLGSGVNDSLMKLSGVYFPDRNAIDYLTVTFATAFAMGLILTVIQLLRHRISIRMKDIYAGLLLGGLNWFSTWFFIRGIDQLPISLFVPVFNAALVFLAGIAGVFVFGEKLSTTNKLGILLAVAAIVAVAFS
jgi:drug/metabolite transporter (DMT)-like permease